MSDFNNLFKSAIHAVLQEAIPVIAQAVAQHLQQTGGTQQAQQNTGFQQPQQGGGMFGGQPQQAQQGGNMFGGQPQQAQQGTPSVTAEMIQTLITPLVQNEQIKQALTAQMQAMGIQNLPDARPDQLPELYQRFQNVKQQAEQAGLLGGQGGGAAPSLI